MREGVPAAGDAKCGVEIFPIKCYKNKHGWRCWMFWFYDFDFLLTPALLFPFSDLKTRLSVCVLLPRAEESSVCK
jgi:hypothetical protein